MTTLKPELRGKSKTFQRDKSKEETAKLERQKNGEWPWDRIPGDRNWHFSVDQKFCKIDQEIEKAIGSLGGHYFRLFSLT